VSFILMPGGEVDKVTVSGGHRVLRKAARQAVLKAAPFPEPPANMKLPNQIRYSMVFRLL